MIDVHSFNLDYLKRLLRFSIRRHPLMLANLVLAAFSVLLELAALATLMPLSQIAAGGQIRPDSKWAQLFGTLGIHFTFSTAVLYFVSVYALRLATQFASETASVHVGYKVQAELSSKAFEKIVKDMHLREIDSKSAGHFINLAGDETARAGAVIIGINQLAEAALLTFVYFAAMFYVSTWLGCGVAVFLLVVALSLRGTLRRSQLLSGQQLEQAKVAYSIFLDALNGLRSVRAMSAESFVTSKYDQIIHQYTRSHFFIDLLKFSAKVTPALLLLVCIGIAVGAGLLEMGTASSLAIVVTALAFLLRFFPTAGQALGAFMRLLSDLRSASDVTHLLEDPAGVTRATGQRRLKDPIRSVELRNVRFAYDPAKPIFRDFSITLRRGRSYAIVGPSGSGKTTLFDLLLGFYSADAGDVLIDGMPISEIDATDIKAHVVLVGQQVTMLNDTVANNVRFGASAGEAEVRAACAAACIDAVIEALPQRYDTVLTFQGTNLSGGQRQRIALARGVLRHPDVLLLDESTTGLDTQTRDRVIENVLSIYRDRIVVFSTHDKDLMARVDEVIRLDSRLSSAPDDDDRMQSHSTGAVAALPDR
jgi:ABC-type multidrug transport system fused ATPase/permease subunit